MQFRLKMNMNNSFSYVKGSQTGEDKITIIQFKDVRSLKYILSRWTEIVLKIYIPADGSRYFVTVGSS